LELVLVESSDEKEQKILRREVLVQCILNK